MTEHDIAVYKSFLALRDNGAITTNTFWEDINSASLNTEPGERPWVKKFAEPIIKDLSAKILAAELKFDLVVGIPSGGNWWAKQLSAELNNCGSSNKLVKLEKARFISISFREYRFPDRSLFTKGAKVLLVDDTVYRGHTSLSVASYLTGSGLQVTGFATPVAIGKCGMKKLRDRSFSTFVTYDTKYVSGVI